MWLSHMEFHRERSSNFSLAVGLPDAGRRKRMQELLHDGRALRRSRLQQEMRAVDLDLARRRKPLQQQLGGRC